MNGKVSGITALTLARLRVHGRRWGHRVLTSRQTSENINSTARFNTCPATGMFAGKLSRNVQIPPFVLLFK